MRQLVGVSTGIALTDRIVFVGLAVVHSFMAVVVLQGVRGAAARALAAVVVDFTVSCRRTAGIGLQRTLFFAKRTCACQSHRIVLAHVYVFVAQIMLQRVSLFTDLAGTCTGGIILVAVVHILVALVVLKHVSGGTGSADAASVVCSTIRGTQGTGVACQTVCAVTASACASVVWAVGVAERNREVAHVILKSVVDVTLDALTPDSGAVGLAAGDSHMADVVVQEQARLHLRVACRAVARTVLGRTSFRRRTALVTTQTIRS